jgi:hypothetical protein
MMQPWRNGTAAAGAHTAASMIFNLRPCAEQACRCPNLWISLPWQVPDGGPGHSWVARDGGPGHSADGDGGPGGGPGHSDGGPGHSWVLITGIWSGLAMPGMTDRWGSLGQQLSQCYHVCHGCLSCHGIRQVWLKAIRGLLARGRTLLMFMIGWLIAYIWSQTDTAYTYLHILMILCKW